MKTFIEHINQYDEVKETLRSLKPNKSPGYDNISSNVVNETSDIFFTPLKYIFNRLQQGIFPENLKITKVSPNYKKDQDFLLTNYRPISVLPCFSKLLERIMYSRLFNTFQKIVSFMKSNLVFTHLTALSMLFYYL